MDISPARGGESEQQHRNRRGVVTMEGASTTPVNDHQPAKLKKEKDGMPWRKGVGRKNRSGHRPKKKKREQGSAA